MNPKILFVGTLLAALLPATAGAAVRVVTTTETLAAIAREVGGDAVKVEALSRGVQDPHFVDANPILAVKLRNADLLVDVGADLEIGWLPPLVTQSRNAKIQPGGAARLTAAEAVKLLDLPSGPIDRSRGDIHPAGNPHFLTDPRRAAQVALAIAARLGQLDVGNAKRYADRAADFSKRMDAAVALWQAKLAGAKGRPVLTRHRTLTYFLEWTGLRTAGELEPRPGVPPPPGHLATMVELAKRDGVKAIVVENYYDTRSADVVARHSGAKVVRIPGDVGGEPGASTYEQYLDTLVTRIAGAVR
ncbi:MAG TPA: metal ABC transporter substrate-binding protein [Anaeromyxobacteraceae bacterium]|nr:metal ABC transporter substrate-binding protein [Anaeromyxobacteraceae bacterium]